MYSLPHFKAADEQEVLAFMKAHPFIILCGITAEGMPVATHVPVLFQERDGKLYLQAHIMRRQQHTMAFEQNPNVLAIFSGAHTYVSASWYSKPNTAGTWNYEAVHVRGTIRFMDEEGLHDLLVRLTDTFENNPHSPALVKHMEEGYVEGLMKAIIAFDIEVAGIEHVFKLSQNRDEKSYNSILQHLNAGDADAQTIAARMQQNKHNVF
ncbi:MAG TPA: FMN-binding negative transcriptional regulator [Chitinophagaceae bacterium]|nr:FMN-binding negative transcriptional regulator [Chitinophagaceae bacterium]